MSEEGNGIGGDSGFLVRFTEKEVKLTLHPSNEGPMAAIIPPPILVIGVSEAGIRKMGSKEGNLDLLVEVKLNPKSLKIVSHDIALVDKKRIQILIQDTLLQSNLFPNINFRGRFLFNGTFPPHLNVEGFLLLHGKEKGIPVVFKKGDGNKYESQFAVFQSDFGIQPHSAFLGALRSRDEMTIRVEVDLSPLSGVLSKAP